MSKLLEQQFGDYVEAKSNGNIFPKKGTNARTPYEHQKIGRASCRERVCRMV